MWIIGFGSSIGFLVGSVIILKHMKKTCQNREDVVDRVHPYVCTIIITSSIGSLFGIFGHIIGL
jgi:hypothetical protein